MPLLALGLAIVAGLVAWVFLGPLERAHVRDQLTGFPDSDATAHGLRPMVLAGLCALPALATVAYLTAGSLSRYLVRQFLAIFLICLCALFSLWLLMDLSDNLSDFRGTKKPLEAAMAFYGIRVPAVLLLLLPYSLLLALLYSLGKLSAQREIVAMIQSGRGVVRLCLPLLVAGLFCTLASLGLNYHWAPVAEGLQDDMMAQAKGIDAMDASQVLYRNTANRRLWMIGAFPPDYEKGMPLREVEITTTDEQDHIISRLSASEAAWDRQYHHWTFSNPVIGRFSQGKPPVFESPGKSLVVTDWPETPWLLIKPGLSPKYLGIPDLNTWLSAQQAGNRFGEAAPYETHWHHRWALPFTCLVTVLLASPLAIHFSRRGPGGGVFLAVVLSTLLMFTGTICLAFGEAGLMPPALAAWLPNLLFGVLGLYLFHRRITGRPIYQSLRRLIPVAP